MDVMKEQIKCQAIADPVAAARTYSKSELYGCLDAMTREAGLKPGESIEHARYRIGKTAEGAAILKAHSLAKAEPVKKTTAPAETPEQFRKSMPGGDIVAQIDELAAKLAREQNVSPAKAKSMAWDQRPDLLQQYNAAQAKARGIHVSDT